MSDPRWTWGDRFILLRQDPAVGTRQKVGVQNEYGWAAYAVDEQLFVKKIAWNNGAITPDYSSNFEIFTNEKFLEVETLGPTCTLEPGSWVAHQETWELHQNIAMPNREADVEQWIVPLNLEFKSSRVNKNLPSYWEPDRFSNPGGPVIDFESGRFGIAGLAAEVAQVSGNQG